MARNARELMTATGGRTQIQTLEMQQFSRRLREIMVRQGLSQSDLAAKLWGRVNDERGYPVAKGRDRISVWLSGKTYPDATNLKKLAEVLGTDPMNLAPDVMASTIEKENPEMAMTYVAGHSDKVFFRVNKLLPLALVSAFIAQVSEYEKQVAAEKATSTPDEGAAHNEAAKPRKKSSKR